MLDMSDKKHRELIIRRIRIKVPIPRGFVFAAFQQTFPSANRKELKKLVKEFIKSDYYRGAFEPE